MGRKRVRVTAPVDVNDDLCHVCNDGGNLIMCANCPHSYHFMCLAFPSRVTINDIPDDWKCQDVGLPCSERKEAHHVDQHEAETETKEKDPTFAWTSTAKVIQGQKHYQSFRIKGTSYRIGDHVYLAGDGAIPRYIGHLIDAWSDSYKDNWISVRWLFLPEETKWGRLTGHGTHEVFNTLYRDDNPVDALRGKCRILSYSAWMEEFGRDTTGESSEEEKKARTRVEAWYARQRYLHMTGEFRPMIEGRDKSTYDTVEEIPNNVAASAASAKSTTSRKRKSHSTSVSTSSSTTPTPSSSSVTTASLQLQLSQLPAILPCREQEHAKVHAFLKQAIERGGLSGGLYLSGMPGTGKTATVHQVIRALRQEHQQGTLPDFHFVEINGMKLPDPHTAYTLLWKALEGKHASPARAALLLDKRFKTPSSTRKCCVLLLDELDYMLTKKQNVIYNLFDWPGRRHARLIVIGISNTLDLPEILTPRVHSRLGLTRIVFPSYDRTQIHTIISSRLSGNAAFHPDAIELCSRKVASGYGDVRRALQICRRAAEICQVDRMAAAATAPTTTPTTTPAKKSRTTSTSTSTSASSLAPADMEVGVIRMNHIERAITEFLSSTYIECVKQASLYEKILLCAMVLMSKAGVPDDMPFEQVCERATRVCNSKGIIPEPKRFDFLQICERLGQVRVLTLEASRSGRFPLVRLNVLVDDIQFALHEDELWAKLIT